MLHFKTLQVHVCFFVFVGFFGGVGFIVSDNNFQGNWSYSNCSKQDSKQANRHRRHSNKDAKASSCYTQKLTTIWVKAAM